MEQMDRYSLFLEALAEVSAEAQSITPTRAPRLSLEAVLEEYLPIPRQTLFFGVAEDGLPVLLDLENAAVGPLLILGDAASGKTYLLRQVLRALILTKDAAQVRFLVIARRPEEWQEVQRAPHCEGVFAPAQSEAADALYSLAARAHATRAAAFTLLILDDLPLVQVLEPEIRYHLQWLLGRGPGRKVWPMATLNPLHRQEVIPWSSAFHTRLYARIADSRALQALGLPVESPPAQLRPGQYAMLEEGQWLRFWMWSR